MYCYTNRYTHYNITIVYLSKCICINEYMLTYTCMSNSVYHLFNITHVGKYQDGEIKISTKRV